jgi:hypothetical protein
MFVNGSKMSNLYRGPSIDATYHVPVHLAMRFRSRRCFWNLPISNTNCLRWSCLLMDPKWAIFIEGLLLMPPTTFRFIWSSGFRVEDFLGIDQSATRIAWVEDFFRNRPITLKSNYGSVFLTQNYELQLSFNVIITITYSTL